MFSTLSKSEIIIFVTFNLSSANAFNLVQFKILSCGNGLTSGHVCSAIELTDLPTKKLTYAKQYMPSFPKRGGGDERNIAYMSKSLQWGNNIEVFYLYIWQVPSSVFPVHGHLILPPCLLLLHCLLKVYMSHPDELFTTQSHLLTLSQMTYLRHFQTERVCR